MATEQLQKALFHLFLVAGSNQLFGLGQILRGQLTLHTDQFLHQRLILFI